MTKRTAKPRSRAAKPEFYRVLWAHYDRGKPFLVGHGAGEYPDHDCSLCVKYVLASRKHSQRGRKGKHAND